MAENQQERTWAMVAHLAALAGCVFPLGHLIGPLVVWLIKKDEFPLVADQGKESLNFQISMTIYGGIAAILVFAWIGIPILIALAVADIVLVILAAVTVNNGQRYVYPATIRLVK